MNKCFTIEKGSFNFIVTTDNEKVIVESVEHPNYDKSALDIFASAQQEMLESYLLHDKVKQNRLSSVCEYFRERNWLVREYHQLV